MEDSQAADVAHVTELLKWAAENKMTIKAVDILVNKGLNSMEAVALLDADDVGQSKMPRGQQKLLLKALQSIQAAEARNARGPEPRADQHNSNTAQLTADRRDGPNAGEDACANLLTDLQTMQTTGTAQTGDEQTTGTAQTGDEQAKGTAHTGDEQTTGTTPTGDEQTTGTAQTGDEQAKGTAQTGDEQTTGTTPTGDEQAKGTAQTGDEHTTGTTQTGDEQAKGTAQPGDEHRQGGQLFEPGHSFEPSSFGGSARPAAAETPSGMTIPGTGQDPRIHLMSATARKSPLSYHDVTDFLSRDTIEEGVVADAHEGKQIVIKSGTKPKLETITLSQWFIANLAIQYQLLCDGNLPQDGTIDLYVIHSKNYTVDPKV